MGITEKRWLERKQPIGEDFCSPTRFMVRQLLVIESKVSVVDLLTSDRKESHAINWGAFVN